MKIDLSSVPAEQREEAEKLALAIAEAAKANPLSVFYPHCAEQARFLSAQTAVVAAFAGNQSGKSTIGAVRSLIELLSPQDIPEHLLPYKRFGRDGLPVHGWALAPTEDKIFDSLKPAILKWCPASALKGGRWQRAFNGERMTLTFANESTLTFKTYKQDPSTLGGATLHFVWYDEPPPRGHRDECVTRLLANNGPEFYTMTPLKSNTGWIRRDIWKKRASPDVTVCKWSMHDNPALNKEAVERTLASYKNDIWRRAREFGDFMDVAGLVYADFERAVIPRPKGKELRALLQPLSHIWGIDPGIRNAAIVCGGFDHHGVDWIYDERLIQDGTPTQYAQAIDVLLARYGLRRSDVLFVIDPAARQRSQATGDTVQTELARVGIFTINGTNDREAGQQQIRDRLLHDRLKVLDNCVGLRDDADELAWEMDEDEDSIGPADDSPYHRLATLRYQVMVRPFYPTLEERATERNLGREPGKALDLRNYRAPVEYGPMGSIG